MHNANTGTYSDGPTTVNFTGFDSLTADPYTTNTLIGESTASTWTLGTAANSGSYNDGFTKVNFSGFDILTPGLSYADTLIGEAVASTWTLGASSITYFDGTKMLTITNSQFETLEAGGAGDTFYVSRTFLGSLKGAHAQGYPVTMSSTSCSGAPSPTASSARAATPRSNTPGSHRHRLRSRQYRLQRKRRTSKRRRKPLWRLHGHQHGQRHWRRKHADR